MNAFSIADRLSPLEGEMAAQRPEGVHAAGLNAALRPAFQDGPHPTDLRSATLPSRGRELAISTESAGDVAPRDRLLDRAMKPNWRRKSSEKIRRGRQPALALVARDEAGAVVGTVRLWSVAAGEGGHAALLLGPLAVDPSIRSAGIGGALMRAAIVEARDAGHGAIVLVGDPDYYERFGFTADRTGALAMPGPFEKHRLLALELKSGVLDGARGIIRPTGRKLEKAA